MEARDAAIASNRQSQQRAAIADALGGHEFLARPRGAYVAQRLTWEADNAFQDRRRRKLVCQDGLRGSRRAPSRTARNPLARAVPVSDKGPLAEAAARCQAQFNALSPAAQAKAMAEGYTLT